MDFLRGGKMKLNHMQTIGLIYQLLFTIVVIASFIMSLFDEVFNLVLYLMLAMLMLGLAYNNYFVFKRKYFTWIYLGLAILVFGMVLW